MASHMVRTLRPMVVAFGVWLVVGALAGVSTVEAAEHRFGIGARFWKTVDDLADDGFDGIEDDGYAIVLNYKMKPRGLFHLQVEAEIYEDGFGGSDDTAVAPIAYLGIGGNLYAAAGVGVIVSDGLSDNVSDPFFAGRIGWELDLLPGISVDINANYYADAFDELGDASTDAITLGALVRFSL